MGTIPRSLPALDTRAQLKSLPAWRTGAPYTIMMSRLALRSSMLRTASSASLMSLEPPKRSAQVYPHTLISGKATIAAPLSLASEAILSMFSALRLQSATVTTGTAAATLLNP